LGRTLWAEEEFRARILGGSGPNAYAAVNLKIVIESYTTKEEVLQLMGILNTSGGENFLSAFRKIDKGSLLLIGGRGLNVRLHAAHSTPTEKGRRILLFTERQSWDVGVSQRSEGRYPFMVIELDVNAKGEGSGRIYEAAQIRLNNQGVIEMESYNSTPKQLVAVRLQK
jgi:hypothetical protein